MRRPLLAILLLTSLLVAPSAGAAVSARSIGSSLSYPAELAFRADGALLYAELASGNVRALTDENAAPTTLAHVAASAGGDGGFTGLATDPADGKTFFVMYSMAKSGAPNGKVERVSRITDGVETVLLDNLPWAMHHDGGRVALSPDGRHLYVTIGDEGDYTRQPGNYPGDPAQDPTSLKGKVLRITRDGSPAGAGVSGWNGYVWAMGFRNPFGIAFGPDGTLYVADNGINHDEVNVIRAGANYGWPACDGDCAGYERPLAAFPDSFGVTGLAYLGGKLYLGDYNNNRLRVIDAATGATSIGWSGADDGILAVARGPDACLYASTTRTIYQVDVAGSGACDLRVATTPPPPTSSTPPPPPPPSSSTPPPPPPPSSSTPPPPPPSSSTPPPPPPPSSSTPPPPPPASSTPPPPPASSTPPPPPPETSTPLPPPSPPPASSTPVGETPPSPTPVSGTEPAPPTPSTEVPQESTGVTPASSTPSSPTGFGVNVSNGANESTATPAETPGPGVAVALLAVALAAVALAARPKR